MGAYIILHHSHIITQLLIQNNKNLKPREMEIRYMIYYKV